MRLLAGIRFLVCEEDQRYVSLVKVLGMVAEILHDDPDVLQVCCVGGNTDFDFRERASSLELDYGLRYTVDDTQTEVSSGEAGFKLRVPQLDSFLAKAQETAACEKHRLLGACNGAMHNQEQSSRKEPKPHTTPSFSPPVYASTPNVTEHDPALPRKRYPRTLPVTPPKGVTVTGNAQVVADTEDTLPGRVALSLRPLEIDSRSPHSVAAQGESMRSTTRLDPAGRSECGPDFMGLFRQAHDHASGALPARMSEINDGK